MRIKLDFITNSSTTCFFAWGTSLYFHDINFDKYSKILDAYYIFNNDQLLFVKPKIEDNEFEDIFIETLYMLCKSTGLKLECNYDSSNIYLGLSPFKMKRNETLAQFKDRVEKCFNAIYFPSSELYQIEEAWRD